MQLLRQGQLPYSFAKRHGVLLNFDGEQPIVLLRDDTPMPALAEVRRLLAEPARYQTVSDDEFGKFWPVPLPAIPANPSKSQRVWKTIPIY